MKSLREVEIKVKAYLLEDNDILKSGDFLMDCEKDHTLNLVVMGGLIGERVKDVNGHPICYRPL